MQEVPILSVTTLKVYWLNSDIVHKQISKFLFSVFEIQFSDKDYIWPSHKVGLYF